MEKYDYKIVIELDEEKLRSDNYEPNETYEIVRRHFAKERALRDVSSNSREPIFINRENDEDAYGIIAALAIQLYTGWTRPYLKVMNWHLNESEDGSRETVENMLDEFRKVKTN